MNFRAVFLKRPTHVRIERGFLFHRNGGLYGDGRKLFSWHINSIAILFKERKFGVVLAWRIKISIALFVENLRKKRADCSPAQTARLVFATNV